MLGSLVFFPSNATAKHVPWTSSSSTLFRHDNRRLWRATSDAPSLFALPHGISVESTITPAETELFGLAFCLRHKTPVGELNCALRK